MTNEELFGIILRGLKETGNYKDCFIMIMEELPTNKISQVKEFLFWLDLNNFKIGYSNVERRWEGFLKHKAK